MLSATERSGPATIPEDTTMPAALAAAGIGEPTLIAAERHAALVGLDNAGHYFHERDFARPFSPSNAMDAAGFDR